MHAIITRTGSYIPSRRIPNDHFLQNEFYDAAGKRPERPNEEIVRKLNEITGIEERRYAPDEVTASEMAFHAAEAALEGVDRESLDYIIVAHLFGDLAHGSVRYDAVPTLASRVKHRLRIRNPYTVATDLLFGCAGWLQGIITADYLIRSGDARRVLVIGSETMARIGDPHDKDSMIYSDGAGATLLEAADTDDGILSHVSRTDTYNEAFLLHMGRSYNPCEASDRIYLKMTGHDIYKYAVKTVPLVVKQNLEKSGLELADVKKVLVHQANEKMDWAIIKRLFNLYGEKANSGRYHADDHQLDREQLGCYPANAAGSDFKRTNERPSYGTRRRHRLRSGGRGHECQHNGLPHAHLSAGEGASALHL